MAGRIRVITLVVLPLVVSWHAASASAGSPSFLDEDGVVHVTNTPTDPRYREWTILSGTASASLRLPSGAPGSFDELIDEASARHGVDPLLVKAVIRAESAFNPAAISLRGAQGLMQLMPQTAARLGVRDSFNPRENIEGGIRHLRYLLDRYPGNVSLAVAAYNAGERAVNAYRGIPPYVETQQYVRRVLERGGVAGASEGSSGTLYRYRNAEGALIYSNLPPGRPAGLR